MKKLTVRLCGGLGNQLFCYAFGRAISERNAAQLYLDAKSAFEYDPYGREYLLDWFPNARNCISKNPWNKAASRVAQNLGVAFSNFLPIEFTPVVIERPPWRYNEVIHKANYRTNVYFVGYWQSYIYFENIKLLLRKELQPPLPTDNQSLSILKKIEKSDSCFVHWRSYNEINNGKQENIYDSYYLPAMQFIQKKRKGVTYFVFSDDPEKARNLFCHDIYGTVVIVDLAGNQGNQPALSDFYLMTACKHSIVGNSSFSWWAAWLKQDEAGFVTAPANLSPWGSDWLPKNWQPIG